MTTALAVFISALVCLTFGGLGLFLAGGWGIIIGLFAFLLTMVICIMMRLTELEETILCAMKAKTSTDEPSADAPDSESASRSEEQSSRSEE